MSSYSVNEYFQCSHCGKQVELAWWHTNRTLNVTSSYTNQTYEVARYAVVNTAPRPEGYLEDYLAANGADIEVPYNDTQKADLYAELASGAESGLDYSSRCVVYHVVKGPVLIILRY